MPKGSRVIMVDDDKILIDMYKERLELAGYKVTACRNGEEGLAKIREEKPDIVLLDVMMPKVNGYEALASLKSDPQTKDIPVVMLSALMRDFNREKAVEAGADDYLIKSEAMPADVITKIEQVLQKYGKSGTPLPGTTPSSIPSATAATPQPKPTAPPPPPVVTASDNPPAGTPKAVTSSIAPPPDLSSLTPSVNKDKAVKKGISPKAPTPEKIIFEPAAQNTKAGTIETEPIGFVGNVAEPPKPKQEVAPVVSFSKPAGSQPVSSGKIETKQKSPTSTALIVILSILLTALVNDLIIYYFFFVRK